MKLAEALQERADLNRAIEALSVRLRNNAFVQDGSSTPEDPNALLTALDASIARLESLMTRINRTNSETMVDGCSLTALIAQKDALTLQIRVYRELISEASQSVRRMSRSEILIKSAVNVRDLQSKCDTLSKKLREVDNKLQATNWVTELL